MPAKAARNVDAPPPPEGWCDATYPLPPSDRIDHHPIGASLPSRTRCPPMDVPCGGPGGQGEGRFARHRTSPVTPAAVSAAGAMVEVLGTYSKMSQKIPRLLDRLEVAKQTTGRMSVSSSPIRHNQTRLTKERQAELVRAYRTGARTLALAAEFGVHRDTVHSILQRAGVVRKAGRARMTRADAEEARRLHSAGTSMRELGRKFGVSDDTVKRHIQRLALPSPDTGAAGSLH